MIVARFFKDNSCFKSYEIKGHANYADHGKDIVCAAVSALAQTGVFMLYENYYAEIQIKQGDIKVKLRDCSQETNLIIETVLLGIRHVQRQYPQYVKIEEVKEGD